MPEFPNPETNSDNGNKVVGFNMNVPVVHSISSTALFGQGWILFDRETKGQSIIAIYKKGDNEIRYDGTWWQIDNHKFRFMEQITEYLTNGKLPEE